MFEGYKIVVNTAAGRRRYMQYLIPFVVAEDIVDRYDIWVNTHNGADIEFFRQVAQKYPKVNLVMQPDGVCNGIASINAFYRDCCDKDTIYFKLDDDVCWMEDGLIRKMVGFRVSNPDYFVVSPMVINNPKCAYILVTHGVFKVNQENIILTHFAKNALESGEFACQLHQWFLDNYIKNGKPLPYIGKCEWAVNRLSINAILWFGRDMAEFGGVVPGDDEEFMSCTYPASISKTNCVNGNAILAHFAFGPQRQYLDDSKILEQYGEELHKAWGKDAKMKGIDDDIQAAMKFVQDNLDELMKRPSPYKTVADGKKPSFADKFKKRFPLLADIYRLIVRDSNKSEYNILN